MPRLLKALERAFLSSPLNRARKKALDSPDTFGRGILPTDFFMRSMLIPRDKANPPEELRTDDGGGH